MLGTAVDIGADESDGTAWNVPTPIIYVSLSGSNGDGRSWATAKRMVQAGLDAVATLTSGGEVWVAQGIYAEHVELPADVSLCGGFVGTEMECAIPPKSSPPPTPPMPLRCCAWESFTQPSLLAPR